MHNIPVAIFGAGVAGLWTLNYLRDRNIPALLFENNSLGGTQTLASQGMIHGGQRFSLEGKNSQHSESLKSMPHIWTNCLEGTGEINLKATKILANNQCMWSPGGFSSNITAFFASKAMTAQVVELNKDAYPDIFKINNNFKGKVYELPEVVLDIKSLILTLIKKYKKYIYKITDYKIIESGSTVKIEINNSKGSQLINASKVVFTAGLGNEKIIDHLKLGDKISQRRPLKQVLVKDIQYPLYAHCVTTDPRPRLTVTAHPYNNNWVWYLGGLVAVKGVELSDQETIQFAYQELTQLFPNIAWQEKDWAVLPIDRAEPFVSSGFLPPGPTVKKHGNILIAWPTKLTFAPALAHLVYNYVKDFVGDNNLTLDLEFPELGKYPWDDTKWQKI